MDGIFFFLNCGHADIQVFFFLEGFVYEVGNSINTSLCSRLFILIELCRLFKRQIINICGFRIGL